MHGRSLMTIDLRIPTMPGRSTSGCHRPGRHCLHQARSAVWCRASRKKGELHPTKNRLPRGLALDEAGGGGGGAGSARFLSPEKGVRTLCSTQVLEDVVHQHQRRRLDALRDRQDRSPRRHMLHHLRWFSARKRQGGGGRTHLLLALVM